jgi:hypothetical protein
MGHNALLLHADDVNLLEESIDTIHIKFNWLW